MRLEARTQAELDALTGTADTPIHLVGGGRFVARGSSHVEARDSSHVEAWDSSHVVAGGSSHVVARALVAIHQHSETATVRGGVIIKVSIPVTCEAWCAFYGVSIADGRAILYKAVREDYRSGHGLLYAPESQPEAPDWDDGQIECGGGLHFVPSPTLGLEFDNAATRFMACPVALADMRPPTRADRYPHKIKARRVCAPIWEVDRHGQRLPAAQKET